MNDSKLISAFKAVEIDAFVISFENKGDIRALFLPTINQFFLIFNLSVDGENEYRIQPYDKTLLEIDKLKKIVPNLRSIMIHEDFNDFLYISNLDFVNNYLPEISQKSLEKRRSIRISKLTQKQIADLKTLTSIIPERNLLAGAYTHISKITDEILNTLNNKKSVKNVRSNFSHSNILLIGPPGTGKTKASQIIVNKLIDGGEVSFSSKEIQLESLANVDTNFKPNKNIYTVQFHPSYSYEDFFEGLRPIKTYTKNGVDIQYVIMPGIFKAASQVARCYSEKGYKLKLTAQYILNNGQGNWIINETSHLSLYKLDQRDGIIYYNGEAVQFTGNENNQDFSLNATKNPAESGLYDIEWQPTNYDENSNFVIFIDELNRGNPAKIFGEALSLIENRKRLNEQESCEITLPYSHETFGVPQNISIICAMNTADKSLSSIDNAFRRRFKVITLSPDFSFFQSALFLDKNKEFSATCVEALSNHFVVLNNTLKLCKVSTEALVGHSYALSILRDAKKIFINNKKKNIDKSIENIVKEVLAECWELELHSLIRDLIGEYRIAEFADIFIKNINEFKGNKLYLNFNDDGEFNLNDYLEGSETSKEKFPWKPAA